MRDAICATLGIADNGDSPTKKGCAGQPPARTGISSSLHLHLKAHRRAHGLTQTELAQKLGVALNTVSNWETGKSDVHLSEVEKMAKIYGVHPAALLMAPEEYPKFLAMQRACSLAAKLPDEQARDWLKMGEHLVKAADGHDGHR